jgi:hypothetical protein
MTEGETSRCSESTPWGMLKLILHFFRALPGESESVISPAIFSASWWRKSDFMPYDEDRGVDIINELVFDIPRKYSWLRYP